MTTAAIKARQVPGEVIAAACLDLAVGTIGARQQGLGRLGMARVGGKPGRTGHEAVDAVDPAGTADLAQDALHQGLDHMRPAQATDHERDFIALQARHAGSAIGRQRARTHRAQPLRNRRFDAARRLDDQLVARGMAEGLVELGEAVEVEERDMHLGRRGGRLLDGQTQPAQELGAIGQAGEAVAGGQPLDLLQAPALVGLVAHDTTQQPDMPGDIELGLALGQDMAQFATGCAQAELRPDAATAAHAVSHGLEERQAVLGLEQFHELVLADLIAIGAQAKHLEAARGTAQHPRDDIEVEGSHTGGGVDPGEAIGREVEFAADAAAAHQMADALGKQHPVGGLDEEVGGAGLVGGADGVVILETGQHQDGDARAGRGPADGLAGLEAIHTRHHGVDEDDVGGRSGQRVDQGLPAVVVLDRPAEALQGGAGEEPPHRVIVDQRDHPGGRFGGIGSRLTHRHSR